MPTGPSALSKPAISKKRCVRPARLAMTDSSTARAVTSCPIHLRTAVPNNGSAGFAAATRPAISARATRLTRLTCNVLRKLSELRRERISLLPSPAPPLNSRLSAFDSEQANIHLIKLEGIFFPSAIGRYRSIAIQNIVDELRPFGFGHTARPFDAAYRT